MLSVRIVAIAILAATFASILPATAPQASERSRVRRVSGCATYPTRDSLDFLDVVRGFVTDTSADSHAWSLLPTLPNDSVRWGGSSVQCDTVAVRIQRLISMQQSDTLWPLIPVLLLRVGPTRWVADPHVGDLNVREYVVLDSSLSILKILKTIN